MLENEQNGNILLETPPRKYMLCFEYRIPPLLNNKGVINL